MAYGINSTIQIGQQPYGTSTSGLNYQRQWGYVADKVWSVNNPIMISVKWNSLTESTEPLASNYVSGSPNKGDVVNVIFDVYQVMDTDCTFPEDWTLVASVRKSRDLRNISQYDRLDGGDGVQTIQGQMFTVDISEICKDLLSYSLLPMGKGTWASWNFGGLNGGARQQDNLMENVMNNKWIYTRNGAYRNIKVRCRTEIIDGSGILQEASAAGSFVDTDSTFMILNNTADFDSNQAQSVNDGIAILMHNGWGCSATYPRQMLTLCPNRTYHPSWSFGVQNCKDIRLTDATEQLQWLQRDSNNYEIYNDGGYDSAGADDLADDFYMKVTAYDSDGAVVRTGRLYDWNQNLKPKVNLNGLTDVWGRGQYRPCTQNVSPVFINANIIHDASPVKNTWEHGGETYTRDQIDNQGGTHDSASLFLNDEIAYYSVSGTMITKSPVVTKDSMFEYRWYKLDWEKFLRNASSGWYFGGIYYTELRSDALTNVNHIKCKGILYNQGELPYLRVYWLNKAGGIDSHTFKGDAKVSYNSSKEIIQRPEPNRMNLGIGRQQASYNATTNEYSIYPAPNYPVKGYYPSDMMRGADVYNGGREVLSVDSTKSGMVSSLPLHKEKAEWLREIASSPSVWTEIHTQISQRAGGIWSKINYRSVSDISKGVNVEGRQPNNVQYVPIIITNSQVDTYNDEIGLVTMTLEYTHSHAVKTQRN